MIASREFDLIAVQAQIELWYCATVQALAGAARACIPSIPQNSLKTWWNLDLSRLKQNAILSHKVWSMLGKPKTGPLCSEKNKDKMLYKAEIRRVRDSMANSISTKLHNNLVNKTQMSFGKHGK